MNTENPYSSLSAQERENELVGIIAAVIGRQGTGQEQIQEREKGERDASGA